MSELRSATVPRLASLLSEFQAAASLDADLELAAALCLHSRQNVDELAGYLEDREVPWITLFGDPGSGRAGLLESARRRIPEAHQPILVSLLLEGYEPEAATLEVFWQSSLAKSGHHPERTPTPSLVEGLPSVAGALALELLLAPAITEETRPQDLLGLAGPEFLSRLAEGLAPAGGLILHLCYGATHPRLLKDALADLIRSAPGITVVLSCEPWERNDPSSMAHLGVPVMVSAPSKDRILRSVRAHPTAAEGWQTTLEKAYEETGGRARGFAERLLSLGLWQGLDLPLDRRRQAELNRRFPAGGDLDSWARRAAELPTSAPWQDLLEIGVLCGGLLPCDLALAYLGIKGPDRQEALDAFDRLVVSGGEIQDLQYTHPSFPRHPIYRLPQRTPREAERERALARDGELLAFFDEALSDGGVGANLLLLRLTHSVPDQEDARDLYHRELAWWCSDSEAGLLDRALREDLADGLVPAQALWQVACHTSGRWISRRRRLLLEIYEAGVETLSRGHQGRFRLAVAILDYENNDLDRAARNLGWAADLLDSDPTTRASTEAMDCQILLRRVAESQGNLNAAISALHRALDLATNSHAATPLQALSLCVDLGKLLLKTRQKAELATLADRAITVSEQVPATGHPRAALALKSVSGFCEGLGVHQAACQTLERALELSAAEDGREEQGVSLKILAGLQQESGRPRDALQCLEEALEIEEELFGADDSRVRVLRSCLIDLYLELGETDRARDELIQSVAVSEDLFGPKSPEIKVQLVVLADCEKRLGNLAIAQELQARLASFAAISPSP